MSTNIPNQWKEVNMVGLNLRHLGLASTILGKRSVRPGIWITYENDYGNKFFSRCWGYRIATKKKPNPRESWKQYNRYEALTRDISKKYSTNEDKICLIVLIWKDVLVFAIIYWFACLYWFAVCIVYWFATNNDGLLMLNNSLYYMASGCIFVQDRNLLNFPICSRNCDKKMACWYKFTPLAGIQEDINYISSWNYSHVDK